jgi:hypothetical protein
MRSKTSSAPCEQHAVHYRCDGKKFVLRSTTAASEDRHGDNALLAAAVCGRGTGLTVVVDQKDIFLPIPAALVLYRQVGPDLKIMLDNKTTADGLRAARSAPPADRYGR